MSELTPKPDLSCGEKNNYNNYNNNNNNLKRYYLNDILQAKVRCIWSII
jgi:hypothetical protein